MGGGSKMTLRLSNNFTLEELCYSAKADKLGIDNRPNQDQANSLEFLALRILQPVRDEFGAFTCAAFRCLQLNRAVGSSDRSQHPKGEAGDFEIPGMSNLKLAEWIRDNLEFDQLILEFHHEDSPSSGWVHVSIKPFFNRNEVLTITKGGTVKRGL